MSDELQIYNTAWSFGEHLIAEAEATTTEVRERHALALIEYRDRYPQLRQLKATAKVTDVGTTSYSVYRAGGSSHSVFRDDEVQYAAYYAHIALGGDPYAFRALKRKEQ